MTGQLTITIPMTNFPDRQTAELLAGYLVALLYADATVQLIAAALGFGRPEVAFTEDRETHRESLN